jgi:hypothetical protein
VYLALSNIIRVVPKDMPVKIMLLVSSKSYEELRYWSANPNPNSAEMATIRRVERVWGVPS